MREKGSLDAIGKLQHSMKRAFDIIGALIGFALISRHQYSDYLSKQRTNLLPTDTHWI